MKSLAAIILAAGKGTRMKSKIPKVLHPVAGTPMLSFTIDLLERLGAATVIVVVGHGRGEVKKYFSAKNLTFVEQKEQLGTGHAVLVASRALKGFKGDVLILSADVPLLKGATIKGLLKLHRARGRKRSVSFLTTMLADPRGYGRVLRDERGRVAGVIEEKDADPAQRSIGEVNTGTYAVDSGFLFKNIKRLKSANAQGEYYLPDLVSLAVKEGFHVRALTSPEPEEVMGVNNRVELARASAVMRRRILDGLMRSGVTIIDPSNTYIESGVRVGVDTTIYPNVRLSGATSIGKGSVIEEGVVIKDSKVGSGSSIRSYSVIESSRIGKGVSIGPFARLRPGNTVAEGVRIGNFVEVKNSRIGAGAKAGHLSYLGDSVIGARVNIGAGTITCNYDGAKKYITRVGDGAFIGSDSQLVAPVKVGRGAYVGSGTTVTRDVPPGSLVTSRGREKVIKGWVKKRFKK